MRANIFEIIHQQLSSFRVDSLVIEKCKTNPILRDDMKFYPKMLGYLLRYVISQYDSKEVDEIVVITDNIPINRKRKAVEKSIKLTLADMLPEDTSYRILHHACKAHYGLQIADYCNWAVFRKWERNDLKHYNFIKPALKSEYEIFRNGYKKYY